MKNTDTGFGGRKMQEVLTGMGAILTYFAVSATFALLIRRFTPIPDEVFRKLLHCILLGSLLIGTLIFQTWWIAALTAIGFAIAVYPILMLAERIKGYSKMVTERKKGELKRSLLAVFAMYAVVVLICWGWRGEKLLALCSIYAWGFGDAMAALIGKRFGRHILQGKHIEGKKSVEGTLAMFEVSFVCVLIILLFRGGMPWYAYPVISLITAAVSAVVELYTMDGMDTMTCPLAAMAVLVPLVYLFGGALHGC